MPSIPKILARALGGQKDLGIGPLTLTRTVPGTRDPSNLSGGNRPTTIAYACKGWQDTTRSGYWQFWQNAQTGTQARSKFVTIVILGGTLPTGVEPKAGDRITRDGVVYTIAADGVTSDPVKATFTCVCRAPGG